MKTVKEMVEEHLSHLGLPVGTDDICPKCGDRCPPRTGLITVSADTEDVFVGCYICLDNEVKDNPLAHALLQTMFTSMRHIQALQTYVEQREQRE